MNRHPKSGRYQVSTTKGWLILAFLTALGVMGLYQQGIAQSLLEAQIEPKAQIEAGSEQWNTSIGGVSTPCALSGTSEWVCMGQTTIKPAQAAPKANKAVIDYKGKKYTQSQLQTASQIVKVAKEEGYDRLSHLLAIADCESSFNPKNSNSKGNKPSWSVDRGLFMWNSHWQKDVSNTCAYDMDCATREAIKDLKAGRASQWVCNAIVEGENRVPFYSQLLKSL